jgi:hypothetical protein
MARSRKNEIVPVKVGDDIKKITGMVDELTNKAENLLADVISWGKRHKMLVAVVLVAIALKRYWLDEEEEEDL